MAVEFWYMTRSQHFCGKESSKNCGSRRWCDFYDFSPQREPAYFMGHTQTEKHGLNTFTIYTLSTWSYCYFQLALVGVHHQPAASSKSYLCAARFPVRGCISGLLEERVFDEGNVNCSSLLCGIEREITYKGRKMPRLLGPKKD